MKTSVGDKFVDVLIYVFIGLLSLICLIPFIHVAVKSISSNAAVTANKVFLLPVGTNFEAYGQIFGDPSMMHSLWLTIIMTIVFTVLGMILTICSAYALSRPKLKGRKAFNIIFIITMYFSAGIIPSFILMNTLNLLNTFAVLVLPLAYSAYNMIILRSSMRSSIPPSLIEAAEIDGCNEFKILISVVLPLSVPILATLSLFYAVGRWNSFQDALYYITDSDLKPLQYKLYELVNSANSAGLSQEIGTQTLQSPEILKAACIMFATIPILIVYPFLQKYFVSGVMVGAVKE